MKIQPSLSPAVTQRVSRGRLLYELLGDLLGKGRLIRWLRSYTPDHLAERDYYFAKTAPLLANFTPMIFHGAAPAIRTPARTAFYRRAT